MLSKVIKKFAHGLIGTRNDLLESAVPIPKPPRLNPPETEGVWLDARTAPSSVSGLPLTQSFFILLPYLSDGGVPWV
ncbi:hypothetical protein DXT97_11970 [Agrobacterium tumefaciens]|nr:hypothetical protein [Agrobacterium tumefaciens]